MTNLVDIVRSIIEDIDLEIDVIGIDGYKITLCKTLHITVGHVIKDLEGNDWKVTELQNNDYIVVEPVGHALPFTSTKVIAKTITYLHGDPISTNNEYGGESRLTSKKTPFIWLVESYNYEDLPRDSSVEAAYDVRLFLMDWAPDKWFNDDHNNYAIKPLTNLQEAFKGVIEGESNFKTLEVWRATVRNRFGDVDGKKLIIDERLSGVELNFKLEVYDLDTCVDGCSKDVSPVCAPVSVTFNGDPVESTPSGQVKRVVVKNNAAIPLQLGVVIIDIPNDLEIEVPEGINTADIFKTGAKVIYQTNDDSDLQQGRGVDLLTLDFDNPFGNTNRLTDDLGGQVYASGVVVDWSTWNQVAITVLCYLKDPEAAQTQTTHITNQPYTRASLTGWYMVNTKQLINLFDYSIKRNYLDYAPFNIVVSGTISTHIWTNTRESVDVGILYQGRGTDVRFSTQASRTMLQRTYPLADLGF